MKRQSRKLLIIGIVFLFIAGACATPTPGPLDQVKAFQDTFNRRDTEGLLALFVDNPYLDWYMAPEPATSTKAVRNIAEFWFEVNARIKLSDCKLESDGSVYCKLLFTFDCWPSEVAPHDADSEFRFKEGKLFMVTGVFIANQFAGSKTYENQALNWARQNLPDDFAKVNPAAEGAKYGGTGDQGSGKLSVREEGQVYHRICAGYARAKK